MLTLADDPSCRAGTTVAAGAKARFVREVPPNPIVSSSGVVPVRVAVPGVAVVAAVADAANQPPNPSPSGEDEAPAEVVVAVVPRVDLDTWFGSRAVLAVEVKVAQQEDTEARGQVDVGLWRPPTW